MAKAVKDAHHFTQMTGI